MKHVFIINPVAGKGKSLNLVAEIQRLCEERQEEYHIEITKGPGHAVQIAKAYAQKDVYRIYAIGGDGTLNEVLNGMMEAASEKAISEEACGTCKVCEVCGSCGTCAVHEPASSKESSLAVIPGGSGNDFIRSLSDEWESEILKRTIEGSESKIDIGKINDRYFINIASMGLDAEVVFNAKKYKKLPLIKSKFAYLFAIVETIFKYKGYNLELEIDGVQTSVKSILVAVANGKYYGGGMRPTPKAELQDGRLELCLVGHLSRMKMLSVFPKIIKGTHDTEKEVSFCKGRRISIAAKEPLALNVDGEAFRIKKGDFQILPMALSVVVPRRKR